MVRTLEIPQDFLDMPRWWHDEPGRRWLQSLPDLAAMQCQQWQLEIDGHPWHGTNALVLPVRRNVDRFALRLAPPGDDIRAQVAALRFWAGRGTVTLLEVDTEARAMLLERLDGSRSLLHESLADALPILGRQMLSLAVPNPPADVDSTAEIAAGYAVTFRDEWESTGKPISRHPLDVALQSAGRLAAGEPADVAVNGDLHYAQVLAGMHTRWVVVDPVLLRGDIEFDLGRILWTRLDELEDDSAIRHAFGTVTAAANVPEDRARDWVIARSMSYLLWGLQQGLTDDPPKCQRILRVFG